MALVPTDVIGWFRWCPDLRLGQAALALGDRPTLLFSHFGFEWRPFVDAGLAPSPLHGCPWYPVRHGGISRLGQPYPELVAEHDFHRPLCCGLGDASDGLFNLSREVRL